MNDFVIFTHVEAQYLKLLYIDLDKMHTGGR